MVGSIEMSTDYGICIQYIITVINRYLYTYVTVRIPVINKLELLNAGQIRFSRSVISKKYTKSQQSEELF